ncbi:MAG: DUF1800 domain-containing protein [Chloroflexota bacterium]|nr:DUF1800 domain-containing protein [Chloroflexota bacterium]
MATTKTNKTNLNLMAHLMRRAGFGADRDELERRAAAGYEATVEELLHPEQQVPVDYYEFLRYFPNWWKPGTMGGRGHAGWVWRMINTRAPLQEKLCLFYHQIFATGVSKVDHYDEIEDMIDMFRENGLGHYKTILMEVAKNPAMIYWLDNHENHATSINENWGRELLELFTMGIGNYTETDVQECSRAFTGWTLTHKLPRFHMGRWDWEFEYRPDDHDNGEKTFLGQTGNFNGEEIIDIILAQPATATFIARHLFSFFVEDEPQVPSWSVTPPNNPEAVDAIANVLFESNYHIGTTLKFILNADFFKESLFAKVKNPTEVVIGTLRLVGNTERPSPETMDWAIDITNMGQDLLNPPSVEGWHTGIEWINSGTLMKRTNFTAELIGDLTRPGVINIMDRLKLVETSADGLVSACLYLMGPLDVEDDIREELIEHAKSFGPFDWDKNSDKESAEAVASEIIQLIVSLREYQFA